MYISAIWTLLNFFFSPPGNPATPCYIMSLLFLLPSLLAPPSSSYTKPATVLDRAHIQQPFSQKRRTYSARVS